MRILRIISVASICLFCGVAFGQFGAGSNFGSVSARGVKIPLYNKGELRFMLRATDFEQHGTMLFANNAIIDIIRKNSDVDNLRLGTDDFYPINSSIFDVVRFWGARHSSEGVIFSEKAQVDNVKRSAEGSDIVQVRTPMMDIDGIGFVANYESRQISVKQNVHIVLRFGGSELEKYIEENTPELVEKNAKVAKYADVWANSMFIDFEEKKVILDGDVKMEEADSIINCDRVELLLGKSGADDSADDLESEMGVSGISKIECFGNVKMLRNTGGDAESVQSVNADYAVYDFEVEKITLLGGRPQISSGNNVMASDKINFSRKSGIMTAEGNCNLNIELPEQSSENTANKTSILADKMEFSYQNNHAEATGNVRINDERGSIHTNLLTIKLKDEENAAAIADDNGIVGLGGMDFSSGNKSVDVIQCLNGAKFYGKEGEEGVSETITYNYGLGTIVLSGTERPWVRQGGNMLEGGEIVLEQKSRRLIVKDDGKIVMDKGGDSGKSVATADNIDMDFGSNLGVLKGNVKIQDALANVECGEMNIYLADKEERESARVVADGIFGNQKLDKTLDRIVCLYNVKARDPKGVLECESLTLKFKDGANGAELDRVEFVEKVKISGTNVSLAESEELNGLIDNAKPSDESTMYCERGFIDMAHNFAEFTDNVRVVDERMKITADKFNAYFIDRTPEIIAEELKESKKKEFDSPEMAFEPNVESKVPRRIRIGEDKNLSKLVFSGDVEITGKDESGEEFAAKGREASYFVNSRLIEMPELDGVKPLLSRGGSVLESEKVVVDLSTPEPEPSAINWKIISFDMKMD